MVRLIPFNVDAAVQVIQWAERKDMQDFFRRFPPVMDWCDVNKVMQLFGSHYLITVDGAVVGLCQLGQWDQYAKSAEISMIIDQNMVSNRPAVSEEAAQQLTNYAFDHVGCEKLYVKILTTRKTLCRRFIEYGFQVEGTLRNSIKGQDEWLLGLLKEEYRRR
jgi:RimJ/RimL family protein N-acetyltransferase